jgi:hypothetical protein
MFVVGPISCFLGFRELVGSKVNIHLLSRTWALKLNGNPVVSSKNLEVIVATQD